MHFFWFLLNFLVKKQICVSGVGVIFIFGAESLFLQFINIKGGNIVVVELYPPGFVFYQGIVVPWICWTFVDDHSLQFILTILVRVHFDFLFLQIFSQHFFLSVLFQVYFMSKLTIAIDFYLGIDLKIILESFQGNNQTFWQFLYW